MPRSPKPTKPCRAEGCEKLATVRGKCSRHDRLTWAIHYPTRAEELATQLAAHADDIEAATARVHAAADAMAAATKEWNAACLRVRVLERYRPLNDGDVRRARERTNGGSYTAAEWLAMLERYQDTCPCCGRSSEPLTADHVIPVKWGGRGDISNIQPLCRPCNSRKGAHHATRYPCPDIADTAGQEHPGDGDDPNGDV